MGAILGQKVAWEECLKAFPVKIETTLVAPQSSLPVTRGAQSGTVVTEKRILMWGNVIAKPLVFGRDLDATAQYTLALDRPDAKDIKVVVHRNVAFLTPDGVRQVIPSSSEDTVQQGVSKTTFSIPTPSLQDAPELAQTRNWVLQLIVEADGMRSEVEVPLNVPELPAQAQAPVQKSTQTAPSAAQELPAVQPQRPTSTVNADPELVPLPKATRLFVSAGSQRVVVRTKAAESAKVINRKVVKGVTWIEVQISTGAKGWIKGEQR